MLAAAPAAGSAWPLSFVAPPPAAASVPGAAGAGADSPAPILRPAARSWGGYAAAGARGGARATAARQRQSSSSSSAFPEASRPTSALRSGHWNAVGTPARRASARLWSARVSALRASSAPGLLPTPGAAPKAGAVRPADEKAGAAPMADAAPKADAL